jgi:hypothetical protein
MRSAKYTLLLLFSINSVIYTQDFGKYLSFKSDWYHINPLSTASVETYYFSTNYLRTRYLLENSDGKFIERGWTPFLSLSGKANFFSSIFFDYNVQGSIQNKLLIKRLSVKYKNDAVSLEIGKNSMWLGHGYHGSLLFSNNAEPMKLIKFQTEQPFRIPYIGKFNYTIFNSWAQDFKILGQRIAYFPVSWLEFGINQTIVYKRNYKFWEFFKVLSASQENLSGHYNNDQRASIDLAVYLPFLKKLPPLYDGKIYFEYAGEDIYAWWQPEDKKWLGPLGFEWFDPGITAGLFLSTQNTELRIEYSENYKAFNLFYNVYKAASINTVTTKKWYTTIPFLNYGAIPGHHMGTEADDLYFRIKHTWSKNSINLFFDKERHGLASGFGSWWKLNTHPEYLYQYGIEYSKILNNITFTILFVYNYYQNSDVDAKVLRIIPSYGRTSKEYIGGLSINYSFSEP